MQAARFVFSVITLAVGSAQAAERLTVAVASNFQAAATEIAAQFSATTGISVRISSGSTGSLYARIVNGAPYDIFLAADTVRPRLLEDAGFAVANSFLDYASGQLVLWSADPQFKDRDCRTDLVNGNFKHLAIANPRTAPYGQAAKFYLETQQLWSGVSNKLVIGENIAQTFQFVATGNANMGLIAASQVSGVLPPATTCFEVLGEQAVGDILIHQAGVILAASRNKAAAERFMRFMRSSTVNELLLRRGYHITAAGP